MKHYDAIVIGSGGGLKIALPAAQQGRQVALIEQGACGGTCLKRGCIPSKMLIWPMELADKMRDANQVDIALSAPPRVEFARLIARVTGTVDTIARSLQTRCEAADNVDYYPHRARFIGDKLLRVGDTDISGDRIFIATGSRPSIPDIPGLADVPYMTSAQALRRTDLPRELIVLGGGYIAVELGNAYRSAGSQVAFLVRSRLMRREDREIADEFAETFCRRHTVIEAFTPTAVRQVGAAIEVAGRNATGDVCAVQGDALLVATGVRPNTDDLGLDTTGIALTAEGTIQADACLRTTVDGVYALGDAVGNHLFRHTVNREAEYLLRTAFSEDAAEPLDYGPVPHAVFADPEIAGVGPTEEEARAQGADFVVGRAAFADSNQGMARHLEHGLCKILVNRATRRLIGAHMVGDEASNMIHILILLMKTGGSLDDLLDMIFIHPALPEIVRDAARDAQAKLAEPATAP